MIKKFVFPISITILLLVSSACQAPAPDPTAVPAVPNTPAATATQAVTKEPTPTSQPTATSQPTELPGVESVESVYLAPVKPWQLLNEYAIPAAYFYAFNLQKEPFNKTEARQAFAMAVDREIVLNIAKGKGNIQPTLASSLTPAMVLGRDLYGEVGYTFAPEDAVTKFAEAGYPEGKDFPTITLLTLEGGDNLKIATEIAYIWRETLGVNVIVQSIIGLPAYLERLANDPPDIYMMAWTADENDPDNFLNTLLFGAEEDNVNYGKFNNQQFRALVVEAATIADDPLTRQGMYVQAEKILCEEEAALIPLYHYYVIEQP